MSDSYTFSDLSICNPDGTLKDEVYQRGRAKTEKLLAEFANAVDKEGLKIAVAEGHIMEIYASMVESIKEDLEMGCSIECELDRDALLKRVHEIFELGRMEGKRA